MESRVFLDSFTLAWEQRKLGELGEILTGSTPSTTQTEYYSDDGIPWVTPTDINANLIYDTPKKLSEEGAEIGRVVPANTILCTCIASIGKNALLTVKGSFNQQINSLTPSKENDAYFLLTESELWSNTMKRMAASGTMQIVNKTEFSELQTMVPSLPEQQQIGEYFRNLDHLITLHQCKESAFSEWKDSGFLQKHKTTWEQRKAKELCSISTGKSNTQDRIEDGKYPFYVRSPIVERSNRYLFDEEAVLTVGDGVGTGKVFHYVNGKYDLHQRVYRMFGFSEEISAKYFYYYFSNHFYDRVMAMTAKTSVDSVRYEMIADMEISLPNKQEQICISMLFEQLDNLITLHQRKPFCINRRQKWKQTTKMQNYSANIMQNGFQYIRKGR